MKPRRVILREPYPTVESTAKLMGVSDRRVKELLRLVRSNEQAKKNGASPEEAGKKDSRTGRTATTKKRTTSVSRKRRAGGKTAGAHA
jgi:hypothetical protein